MQNNVSIRNKNQLLTQAGYACMILLLLLVIGFLVPVSRKEASAVETGGEASDSTYTNKAVSQSDLQVNVQPMISVGLQQAVEIDVTPKESGVFAKNAAKMRVSTNSPNGYSIQLSTTSDNNNLVNLNSKSDDVITPVELASGNAGVSEEGFKLNSWGYSLVDTTSGTVDANLTYQPVPVRDEADSIRVPGDGTHTTASSYNLTFSTKIGTNLPAGSYTNSIMVSAVANPITLSTLNQLTYMQDMTTEICQNTKGTDGNSTITPGHEVHRRLIDTRDGKAYWVARLADGNCWMTQNLALDLSTGKTLTPSDSDVAGNWTPSSSTEKTLGEEISGGDFQNANYTARSWNLGDYVLAIPLNGIGCGDFTMNVSISNCSKIQNVSGWQPIYKAQTGIWKDAAAGNGGDISADGLVAADIETKTYDAHYLIGNYYQYNAAVAGGAPKEIDTQRDLPNSICPKGWRLPTAGNQNIGGAGNVDQNITLTAFLSKRFSLYDLLAPYGYNNGIGYNWGNGSPSTAITMGTAATDYEYNTAAEPLSFVRSGRLYPGKIINLGNLADYWTSTTANTNSGAWEFHFNGGAVSPSRYEARYFAFSVRCVAK